MCARERGLCEAPCWSPKSALVAYMSRQDDGYDTRVSDVATGTEYNLTQGKGSDESPHWGPNGKHLIVVSHQNGTPSLYILNSQTGETFPLPVRGNVETPAWSR